MAESPRSEHEEEQPPGEGPAKVRVDEAEVSEESGRPARFGLAPSRPPPAVVLHSLFDQGVRKKFTGDIKSFNPAKGYGFITVPKVWELMRCDVHFQLTEVYDVDAEKVSEKVRVGSKCTFWCNLDRSGRPQAKVVRITWAPERPPEPVPKPLPKGEEFKYRGVIKSFHEDTGYGFISCKETFARFNRDVFLHHKQLNGFKVNDAVKFQIFVDQTKGQPKAISLEAADPEDEVQSPQATSEQAASTTQETATPPEDESAKLEAEVEETQDLWEDGWTRYRVEEGSEEFWWWREQTEEYFLESESDDWSKFRDQKSNKEYWWHKSGSRCFWASET